jgi:uncharacterized protein YneF (UPF0154 family)
MSQPSPSFLDDRERIVGGRRAPWLIVVIVALVFGRVIGQGISPIDDRQTIFANPKMNRPDPPELFGDRGGGWYWKHGAQGLFIPVTYSLWFLLAMVSWSQRPDANGTRLDPRIFHAASLLIYIGNTLLVYWLLRKLLRARQVQSYMPALAGALVYGLHPLQVESVAWISGMKDLLYCGFSLIALLLYVQAVEPSATDRSDDVPWKRIASYLGGIAAMVVGMLCKPTAMVVPLMAFVIDLLILRRRLIKVALSVLPYLITAIPLMIVAKIMQPALGVPTPLLWQRPIVAGASLAFYLGKLIAPVGLAFDYGWRPAVMVQKPWFWWIAGVPLVLGIILLRLRQRRPWLLAGALIGAAALLPVLGLNPFLFQFYSTVADHYMVLAMLGAAIAVAGLLSGQPDEPRRPALAAVAVISIILGVLSFLQLGYWNTEDDMLRQILAVNPQSAMALNHMGEIDIARGDLKNAETAFAGTLANPLETSGTENLVHLYVIEGRPQKAVDAFRQLLVIVSRFPAEARPDISDWPMKMTNMAIQTDHWRDVPFYLPYIAQIWFANNFESWLGGPMVKYLPAMHH